MNTRITFWRRTLIRGADKKIASTDKFMQNKQTNDVINATKQKKTTGKLPLATTAAVIAMIASAQSKLAPAWAVEMQLKISAPEVMEWMEGGKSS